MVEWSPVKTLVVGSNPTTSAKCRSGGMADTTDLKSVASNGVRVRVPPSIPNFKREVSVIGSTDRLIICVP